MVTRRRAGDRTILSLLALTDFALRIAVVQPGSFQFSDGIRLMEWSVAVKSKVFPLYPALVSLVKLVVGDPILAASLVASILGGLTVFPVFGLARRLFGRGAAWWAVIFYSISLSVYIQSAGVTAGSTFAFFLLWALIHLLDHLESGGRRELALLLASTGLACLARPEGLVLIPLAAWRLAVGIRQGAWKQWSVILSLLPFPVLVFWLARDASGTGYLREILAGLSMATPVKFLKYLRHYIGDLVAGLWFVFGVLALLGIWFSVRRPLEGAPAPRRWAALYAYLFLGFLVALCVHWAFVPRLLAPLIILSLILAGVGAHRLAAAGKIPRAILVVLTLLVFTASVAIVVALKGGLSTIGADIRIGAQALGVIETGRSRITSDLPVETAYYSGKEVGVYIREALSHGDIVVLHNITTDLPAEIQALKARFRVTVLDERTSPYVSPKRGGLPVVTDKVRMMDLSEREQELLEVPYRTVIVRVDDPKEKQ